MKTLVLPAIHILVFKTDIRFDKDMPEVEQVMASLPDIQKWNVDHHDVDNILRIEASNLISEEIISAMQHAGFICIELED
jgi:hypothetical protein